MKPIFTLLFAIGISYQLIAQSYYNYIVNTPNSTSPGYYNVIVGPSSGTAITFGESNTFIGNSAGKATTDGRFNVFMGANAGLNNKTGSSNIFIGGNAGLANTTAGGNIFIGNLAGSYNTNGQENIALGNQAGGGSSWYNISIGSSAGGANSGGNNVFLGNQAGYSNSGNYNTFLGNQAGFTNNDGSYNVYVGFGAGVGAGPSGPRNGQNNTFLGFNSGSYNRTGANNTFLGYQAGYNNTTGSNNIIIGPNSGTAITTGDDNVLMGYNSQAEDGLRNATAIGSNSRVAINNALILGNQANVGIGTSAPTTRLEVVSETPDASGLRLSNLTTFSPVTQSTDQFLSVDQQGNVVKARYLLRINNPAEWSDKVFAPGYQLRPLTEVKQYIDVNGHLPGIPSAEQVTKEGVDLVRMNAKLLEKVEELTLYLIEQQKTNKELKAEIDELKALFKK